MLGLVLAHAVVGTDSAATSDVFESEMSVPKISLLHVVASAYGSLGGYSTDTRSQSASAYFTLDNAWQDYYTLGFASHWLDRDDAGGNYYKQQLFSARASWLFDYRVNLSVHYGYLNEGTIEGLSASTHFHFVGGGANYWFSPTSVAGASFTLSLSEGKLQSNSFGVSFAFNLTDGIWATSTATSGKAEWSPRLFVVRQSLSVPLGGENFIQATADVGRRVFHFDDQLLVVYNQREIQTGHYLLKGIVKLTSQLFIVPSLEYNAFDDYNVKYGSLGVRVVF